MKAFLSYAHNDHAAYEAVCVHLRPIERAYGIEIWADKRIKPGDYWTQEIAKAIADASIHILLISPDFFASNYIWDHELPAINEKYRSGDLVVPLLVKRCCWAPFLGPLQAAPMTGQGKLLPIAEWKPQDHGYDASRVQTMTAIEGHFDIKANGIDWSRS